MKTKLLRLISCLITCCLTICILGYLTKLMERKSSDEKYADFWNQEEDFDVLFMGTSHVINAVFPMELWNDYGIVSYNFGGHDNQIATSYWVMKNAFRKTTPKVVVIDCLRVESNIKASTIFSYMHLSLDTFPFSSTKLKAIWDLLDDPCADEAIMNGLIAVGNEPRTKIGLLWNYSVYHSRWNEINQSDFNPIHKFEKGAETRIAVTNGNLERIPLDDKMEPGKMGEVYLRKMIEECQDRDIAVLLTYLPFPASEYDQKTANYIYDVAKEYNVNYINFLDLDLINYKTDLWDEASHLNPSGARKVTNYLGKFLLDNYDISDQRNNIHYSAWHEDYKDYTVFKNNNLKTQTSLIEYLMLLSSDDVEINMNIKNKDIYLNPQIVELLSNLGIERQDISNKPDIITVENKGKNVVTSDDSNSNTQLNTVVDANGMLINVYRNSDLIDSVEFVYWINPQTYEINTLSVNRPAELSK